MAKKKSKAKSMNMIYVILGLVTTVLTFVSMAFAFIGTKTTTVILGGENVTKDSMSMTEWFDFITNAEKAEGIASWQIAKILFIVMLVLVGIVAVGMLINMFVKKPIVSTITNIVGIVTILVAIVFFILTIVGGSALSTGLDAGSIGSIAHSYYPHLAIYFLAIFGIATPIMAYLASKK